MVEKTNIDTSKEQQHDEPIRAKYYYGRPSPFLSNFLFLLNPAPDNLIASNCLSIFEILLSMGFLRIARKTTITSTHRYGNWIKRIGSFGLGIHLGFCGVAQLLSNELNGDDTILAADAKRQRLKALRNNEPINWWFGPKYYEYMNPKELSYRLARSHKQTSVLLATEANSILAKCEKLTPINDTYFKNEIIPALKQFSDTAAETSENAGFITIDKPPLVLGDLQLDDETDVNYVWFEMLDPWNELWQEVNLSVNFVPKWTFIEDTTTTGTTIPSPSSPPETTSSSIDTKTE